MVTSVAAFQSAEGGMQMLAYFCCSAVLVLLAAVSAPVKLLVASLAFTLMLMAELQPAPLACRGSTHAQARLR